MAELPSYFKDFLARIRLTDDQVSELQDAHLTLRDRLEEDENLSQIQVSDFLQGSYRRSTIVRPAEGKRVDVDVIAVTKLDRHSYTPQQALEEFRSFLNTYYSGKWTFQGRSIGIALDTVDLDLVITSAPSEVAQRTLRSASVKSAATLEEAYDLRFNEYWIPPELRESLTARSMMFKAAGTPEWKLEPLWIPDRDAKEWQQTHPLEQIRWTRDKNARTDGHFINVVKALKWWRRVQDPDAKHPKSYPLERIFGECCPDSIQSVATGVTETLEQIVSQFGIFAATGTVPTLCDHGLPDQNVLKRISGEEFGQFYESAKAAAVIAREALDEPEKPRSAKRWADLFGEEFPLPPEGSDSSDGSKGGGVVGGYSDRGGPSTVGSGRFA